MNKLIVAFIALIGVATIGQQACAENDFDQETRGLTDQQTLFAGFCQESLQYVKKNLKNQANARTSWAYKMFFNTFGVGLTNEALAHTHEMAKRFVDTLTASEETNSVEREKENEEVNSFSAKLNIVNRATNYLVDAARETFDKARQAVTIRGKLLMDKANRENFLQGIADTCFLVKKYEAGLAEKFKVVKAELLEQTSSDDSEKQKFLQSITMDQLNCRTPKYISRLEGVCGVVETGLQFAWKAMFATNYQNFKIPEPTGDFLERET